MNPGTARALDRLLILHADDDQNCSTATVRLVGSAHTNLYASVSAGINALRGPLHGGADRAVVEMLERIRRDGGDVKAFVERVETGNRAFGSRSMSVRRPATTSGRTTADHPESASTAESAESRTNGP